MSIFGKKKNEPVYEEPVVEDPQPVAEPEPQPEPEKPQMPKGLTVIGVGTVFVGDITTNDRIEINGTVKGNIQSFAELHITGTGLLYGNAQIASLNVDGGVQGEICCSGTTHITDKGTVKGILASTYLNTAEGATIDGTVKLGAAAVSKGKTPEETATAVPAKEKETEAPAETSAELQTEDIIESAAESAGDGGTLPQEGPVSIDELFS